MYRLLSALKRDQKGATAIEYGLIAALLVLGMMVAFNMVAKRTGTMWNNVASRVTNA